MKKERISFDDCWTIPRGLLSGIPVKHGLIELDDEVVKLRNLRPRFYSLSAEHFKLPETERDQKQVLAARAIRDSDGHLGRFSDEWRWQEEIGKAEQLRRQEVVAGRDGGELVEKLQQCRLADFAGELAVVNSVLADSDISMWIAFDHPNNDRPMKQAAIARFVGVDFDPSPSRVDGIMPLVTGKSGDVSLLPEPYRVAWPFVEVVD